MGIRNILSASLTLTYLWSLYCHSHQTSQCEPVIIPMCKSMQWNLTQMPNIVDQNSQQNAQLKIEEYQPLVRDRCSEHLQFFLCAIFAPICTTNFHDNPIPPCQEICEAVRTGCEPVIQSKYNKTWPTDINCSRFPKYNNGVCISPQAIQLDGFNSQQVDSGSPETDVDSRGRSCDCRKKTRLHIRRYIQSNFGYVIRAAVEGTRQIGNDLIISLSIKKILKNKSDLRLKNNETLILWAAGDGCPKPCPAVRKRKEYIIACSKIVNSINGRLMFDTNTCMISRWKGKWGQAIEDWETLSRLPEVSRNRELKRLRHRKKYERPRQTDVAEPEGEPEAGL